MPARRPRTATMKVFLSTPPGKTTELWPPLGLLYIAASLRARGRSDVQVLDAFCRNLSGNELAQRVVQERPDVFGINCSTHTFLDAIEALRKVYEAAPDTTLVMGGYHSTFAAEKILRAYPFVDYVLKGEAERSFPDLLDRLEAGEPPQDVDGITYLEDGQLVSRPLAVIRDLDALPFPDRTLLGDLEYGYFHQNIRLTFGKFTTIVSSRGCPFACTYCSCAAFSQRRWRARSAANVVDELEGLYDRGYENVVFVDDNFTLKKSRVREICEGIRDRKIRMRFYCEGRVDNAPYELLRTMKRAGFDVMYFGVESPSPHVLGYYKKGITAAQAERAVADAKRAGMIVVTSFIIGAPVEGLPDVQRTIDFIRTLRPHAVQVNILDCLIGTPIWDDLTREGIVAPEDWKRNHRIWEYHEDGLTRDLLGKLSEDAYAAHIQGWQSKGGLKDFVRLMGVNRTGRKVVLGNLFNPNVRRRLTEGYQASTT
ncbi:MAG TPA: radical SAM protein [Thermoplasmata archaeon]|nr:radical SAM protein [Thermoplasmata archaeon]